MKSSLVSRITLKNFRGLAEANLEGLAPLTVLTGRNGCGKSTVLEGLFIGASSEPAKVLGLVAAKRRNTPNAGRWLFSRGRQGVDVQIEVDLQSEAGKTQVQRTLRATSSSGSKIEIRDSPGTASNVELSGDGKFSTLSAGHIGKEVRWIDTSEASPDLAVILSKVRGSSFRDEADDLIRSLLPGAVRLDVSVSDDLMPFVDVTYREYAVPLSVAGDGVQAAVQLALELANIEPGGLALIEEPEAFLHPGGLLLVAKVLARTMKRGVQIVLTTHSLDLIDALAEAVADGEQEKLALFRLRLVEGKLHWGRYSGSEVALARFEVAEDLR